MLLEFVVPNFVFDSVVPPGNLQSSTVRGHHRTQIEVCQRKERRDVILDPASACDAVDCLSARLEHWRLNQVFWLGAKAGLWAARHPRTQQSHVWSNRAGAFRHTLRQFDIGTVLRTLKHGDYLHSVQRVAQAPRKIPRFNAICQRFYRRVAVPRVAFSIWRARWRWVRNLLVQNHLVQRQPSEPSTAGTDFLS